MHELYVVWIVKSVARDWASFLAACMICLGVSGIQSGCCLCCLICFPNIGEHGSLIVFCCLSRLCLDIFASVAFGTAMLSSLCH